jgi:acyl carrier protein
MTMTDIRARVSKHLATILQVPAETIDLNTSLEAYGMNSILAVKLSSAIGDDFGLEIEPGEALGVQTANDLVALVSRKLAG